MMAMEETQTTKNSPRDPQVGLMLGGRYELLERIGDGGTGSIYRARHTGTDATVAIKLIHRTLICDMKSVARFQQEAKILGSLQHPNIIGVKAIDADSGLCFIVMEHARGISLSQHLKKNGPLTGNQFQDIFAQAASALAFAHSKSVIHRDIKSSNLMIAELPNNPQVLKILDFGLSKLLGATDQLTTESGICLGSAHYMSPEQCIGESADQRSDIYSLGCVMYEALSGKPPFEGENTVEIATKQVNEPFPQLEGKDVRPLMRIINKCTAKDPKLRYQSMDELLVALREGELLSVKMKGLPPSVKKKRSLVPLMALSVGAFIGLAAMCWVTFSQKNQSAQEVSDTAIYDTTPGEAVHIMCEHLMQGQAVSEVELKRVQNIATDPGDNRLRRLADLTLAVHFDKSGDSSSRDKSFKHAINIVHQMRESTPLTAEWWAYYLKKSGNNEEAKRVLKEELRYATTYNQIANADELQEDLNNFNQLAFEPPQLH